MRRSLLGVLLVAGVVVAGAGAALLAPATYGWTAYSPISGSDIAGLVAAAAVRRNLALTLLVVGAGSTGAAIAALVLTRRS